MRGGRGGGRAEPVVQGDIHGGNGRVRLDGAGKTGVLAPRSRARGRGPEVEGQTAFIWCRPGIRNVIGQTSRKRASLSL